MNAQQPHKNTIAVEVLDKVLSVTKPLSVRLQGEGQDLFRATESVQDCIAVLKDMRSGNTFDQLFANVETAAGEPVQMPRLVRGRQRNRLNIPADTPLEFFKRNLSSLIPAFTCEQPFDSLIAGISIYRHVHKRLASAVHFFLFTAENMF